MNLGSKKKSIPIFNNQSESFAIYEGKSSTIFSQNSDDYFSNDFDGLSFELNRYLDILVAPYYVVNRKWIDTFPYPYNLVTLFFELFPTPSDFEAALKRHAPFCAFYLTRLVEGVTDPNKAISIIGITEKSYSAVAKLVETACWKYTGFEYSNISMAYLEKLHAEVKLLDASIRTLPIQIITHKYYFENPHISWPKNPFAFFHDFFFGRGMEKLEGKLVYEQYAFSNFSDLISFIEVEFCWEVKKTLGFIISEMEGFNKQERNKKIMYLKQISSYITTYYKLAAKDTRIGTSKECCMVFQWLSLELKQKYPTFTIETDVNDLEFKEYLIKQTDFIINLPNLKVSGKYQGSGPMMVCQKNRMNDFVSLLAGNMEKVKSLPLNGECSDIYYLIHKIIETKPFFQLKDLERVLCIEGKSFKSGAYSTFKSSRLNTAPSKQVIDHYFKVNPLNFNLKLPCLKG